MRLNFTLLVVATCAQQLFMIFHAVAAMDAALIARARGDEMATAHGFYQLNAAEEVKEVRQSETTSNSISGNEDISNENSSNEDSSNDEDSSNEEDSDDLSFEDSHEQDPSSSISDDNVIHQQLDLPAEAGINHRRSQSASASLTDPTSPSPQHFYT